MERRFYGLWYKEPSNAWVDALPIGNGRLGATLYGGIQQETIVINEETVWDGEKNIDRTNPDAYQSLLDIRKAIFNREYEQATEISNRMLGIPMNIKCYQPLMNISISMANTGEYHNYIRALDIEQAVYYTAFDLERYSYQREAFVSAPDNLMLMKWQTNCPKGLTLKILLDRFSPVDVEITENVMVLTGKCCDGGVEFASAVQVFADSGTIKQERGMLRIDNASTIEFRIAAFTDYTLENPVEQCMETLNQVRIKSYEQIKAAHIAEYRSLYARQSFSLNGSVTKKSTREMLQDCREGKIDNGLFELYYNYLRYLLICSSRPGGQPSNLQGIWNDNMQAPWNSDFHPNVNMQVNYWAAEGFNLPECVEPLIDWMKKIVPSGERTAKVHYHARGWVLHHVSDIFGCTTPMDGPWGIWPFGGTWLCRHVFEHYLYNRDKKYLKEVLPMIEGAVQFMLDFLIECPSGMPGENHLVTCPSHSPENRFVDKNGADCYLTYAATMDMEIIYDLFEIYLKSLDELQIDSNLRKEVESAKDRLVQIRINKKTGCIAEWIEDYEEAEPGHRHVSHLYALYPGTQIAEQEDLLEACEKTLDRRLSNNYDGQGWCYGWIAALFARLKKSNRFLDIMERIVRECLLDSLLIDAHGRPQVGDGQAFAAAIQEALIQSHKEVIEIFPALPDKWSEGSLCGMRVRNGHIFDLYWKNGTAACVRLKAALTQTVKVKTTLSQVTDEKGNILAVKEEGEGILVFEVRENEEYTLTV